MDSRTAGPIGRAITLEAIRLAAQTATSGQHSGEPANADWSRLARLEPSAEIAVMLIRGGRDIKGHFVSADETSVSVNGVSGVVEKVARTDVFEVTREPSWIRRHPGPTGALIGAAAGFALIAVTGGTQCSEECGLTQAYFLIGTGAGAGIGAAVGSSIGAATHSKRAQVLYRAP